MDDDLAGEACVCEIKRITQITAKYFVHILILSRSRNYSVNNKKKNKQVVGRTDV